MKLALQSLPASAQQPDRALDTPHGAFDFSGPWFTNKVAAAYVCCASVQAFYDWKRRHHIISRNNGTVAKADLDRALRVKNRRGRHPNSAANLLKSPMRHGRDSAASRPVRKFHSVESEAR